MQRSSLAFGVLLFGTSMCRANIGFMPGDSFFHSRLTQPVVDRVSTKEALVLEYSQPPTAGGLGGYGGFRKIEITGLSEKMVGALRDVYYDLRAHDAKELRIETDDHGNEVVVETNGFHLFVHRRDVNWNNQRFGLKYNENWMNLPEDAFVGSDREGFAKVRAERYTPFLKDYRAVSEDWKNSSRFPALSVDVPAGVAWGLMHQPIDIPVTVRAEDVQLVVLRYDELGMYFKRKRFCDFFCITVDECMHMEWTDNGLQQLPKTSGTRVGSNRGD